jgi:predicted dehydrogenase
MAKIRVGIFGTGRGIDLARNFLYHNDCEVVALCDNRPNRLENGVKRLGKTVKTYTDFDEFLNSGIDAVVLANFFHEHAPYAIKCFEKNVHVFSECISNGTMAEGVELIRAFEKSKSIYFIAENYPQMFFNREMKRIIDSGALGRIVYAEGEYNHAGKGSTKESKESLVYFEEHWRNYLPRTYYVTHALGPLMRNTGATPKRVTCFPVKKDATTLASASQVGDIASTMITLNDDGSVFRFFGHSSFGGTENSYRFCGTKGQVENVRGMGGQLNLLYNEWDKPEELEKCHVQYTPGYNDPQEDLVKQSGHGGGDFITTRMFIECIVKNVQPEHPFDIYGAVNMSSVAILAHRSMMEGGVPYDIPDFTKEEVRKQYENDRATPFYYSNGQTPTIPCSSDPNYKASEESLKKYREL